ncbi:MAG: ACT domain-containing protein [Acutalibacteraceae bacterium]
MNAVITVIGKDKVGIMAGVCVELQKLNVNILDISQTVLHNDIFTMSMLVDIEKANCPYDKIVDSLNACGESLGVNIRIQREEIFNAMHKV